MNDALGSPQSLLVIGGTSEIARATVRALAARRCRRVVLAGRDKEGLGAAAAEATAAGVEQTATVILNALEVGTVPGVVETAFAEHGDLDMVLVAVGVLGEGAAADPLAATEVLTANLTGPAAAALTAAACLERQGHGVLVVLSSVAGERARRANYVYGASKAGLDALAQGLGDSLHGSGVRVMVVRPGFVKTRMTAGMKPAPLSTTADAVAEAVVRGLETGAEVVWVPSALRWVMSALRHLPRAAWRRLPF